MKNLKRNISLVLFSLSILSSCNSDEEDVKVTSADLLEIRAAIETGEWAITYFLNNDENKTAIFEDFQFSFNAENYLVATNGADSLEGEWTLGSSNNPDDDHVHVDFDFDASVNFEAISKEWDVTKYNSNKIEMFGSNSSGTRDFLTLVKL